MHVFLRFPSWDTFFFCLCREKNTKITKAIFDLDGSPFLWFPFAFSSSFCCQLHRQRQYPISQNPPPFCLLEGMVFGDFSSICSKAPLPLCTLVKPLKGTQNVDTIYHGILPKCYARTVDLANTLIFEIGTAFINLGNLVILLMIIYLVRLRYTSVARKEMIFFFWSLISHTVITLIIDTGVSPPGSRTYAYFVAYEVGNTAVVCWSLLFAGLSSFNFWDDGSFQTIFSLYISSAFVFIVNYLVAIFTFKGWGGGLQNDNTIALYVFYFVLNAIMLGLWLVSQLIICCFTLVWNWWALGALFLTCFFFAASQVLLYGFSEQICLRLNHYVDGSLFSTLSTMFCFMMIYKFWDIITFDDDEYYRFTAFVPAVANKQEASALLKN